MRFLLLGLLFAVSCAGKVHQEVKAAPKQAPLFMVMLSQVTEFMFLFPNEEKATEWCIEHKVQCRGVAVEIKPVQ
jgi:hypothetical protein